MGNPTDQEEWFFYRVVTDGEKLQIKGLNVWDHEWESLGRSTRVKDPVYGQDHVMGIYEITDGNITVTFAAGEFSNLIWGFYVQSR